MKNFRQKSLGEIKLWAWLAVVLPITSLAALFFLWVFGWKDLYSELMVVGATTMFMIAAIWWWWAIWKIAQLVNILSTISDRFGSVHEDITYIRRDLKDLNDPKP